MDTHPKCGVLGVKLVGRDGSLQPSCRYDPTPWNLFLAGSGLNRLFPRSRLVDDMNWDHASERDCDWVPGCFYLVRHEVIEKVGLFDPRYFVYYEEVDHCRAVRQAGWSVMYYPFTQVTHLGGESAKADASLTRGGGQISVFQIESELLYFRKHQGLKGVLMSVLLVALADAIVAGKALLRRCELRHAGAAICHAWLTVGVLFATRFGSRSAR